MVDRDYGFQFDGETVFSHVNRDAPTPTESSLEEDFFVYVMGPYTAFDATEAYSDGDELKEPFIEDPLFNPDEHIDEDNCGDYELALRDFADELRGEFHVRAFLATDINIPTEQDSDEDSESMSVLDQSVAFAAVSDAVLFVFTEAGLTTGVGAEVGSILGEFHLRRGNPEEIRKPRQRFRIFKSEEFSRASIDEVPSTYGIDTVKFSDREFLTDKIGHFLSNIERDDPDRPLPVFNPYES